jgi:CheY-like chemotaxis protein
MLQPDLIGVHIFTDDDRVRMAGRSLPSDRFSVTFSSTAPEALAAVRRNHPDVVVLELQVGDYGGFALAKDLHSLPGMEKLPIVMLCDRPHDRWLCRQAGASEVIVKPLPDPSVLLEAVDAALSAVA